MTPYERGFADCRERAAKVCEKYSDASPKNMADLCHEEILSLQPEAPDSQPDSVVVPRSLAERTEAMFRSVDPKGCIAQEWLVVLAAAKEERDAQV